jgi:hypothetical protein
MPIDVTANVTLKHDNEVPVFKKRKHKRPIAARRTFLRQLLDITGLSLSACATSPPSSSSSYIRELLPKP